MHFWILPSENPRNQFSLQLQLFSFVFVHFTKIRILNDDSPVSAHGQVLHQVVGDNQGWKVIIDAPFNNFLLFLLKCFTTQNYPTEEQSAFQLLVENFKVRVQGIVNMVMQIFVDVLSEKSAFTLLFEEP